MAIYEVTLTLNNEELGSTRVDAVDEDDAIETVENDLDISDLTLRMTGYICVGSDEFSVDMEYTPRDIDVENNFGEITFKAIEIEEEDE